MYAAVTMYTFILIFKIFRAPDFDFGLANARGYKFENSVECFAFCHMGLDYCESAIFQRGNCHIFGNSEIVDSIQGKKE